MTDLQVVEDLLAAQAYARSGITATLIEQVRHLLDTFDGWYDESAVARLAAAITAPVEAGQRQVAALTDAFLTRAASELLDKPAAPTGVINVTGLRKGVAHRDVYGRLAKQYRYDVSRGLQPERALQLVVTRSSVVVDTDIALAMRAQARRFMIARGVDGWRRVLRPELSRDGSCGLCIAASERLYVREDLMPLHERCNCEVLPIVGENDPGDAINAVDLKALYAAAGSTAAKDLKRVRYVVHEHGELGPVLRVHGQHFRGPDDIAA